MHSTIPQSEWFRAIIESCGDAIIGKQLDGTIVTWNKGAERLFGYTAEEAVGQAITILVPPGQPDELPALVERLTRGERVENYETVLMRKHGSCIDVSVTISPVKGSTGRIIGASSIVRDVTAKKEAEAALHDAVRHKDEFLAMLSHELRNPLAPIRNSVQILRAMAPPVPELQWARDVIDRQVQQLTRLVDDLLDLSRISSGKITLHKERVELTRIVSSAVEGSRPLIEKWEHELAVDLPPQPVYLIADETRLTQVLLNLLNNAAKYTPGGGHISLTADVADDEVTIRVKDTGIGIPAEMLPHVFEMFTQVDRSLERSEGGLGIGLTLVQRLVELHGGTVQASSAGPGKGSEFSVVLPVTRVGKGFPGALHSSANGEQPPSLIRRRILVVDDNQDAADTLAMLLRVLGNEVRTAHDGLEAVGAAEAFEPELVLLDIGLPKLDGYEAANRIRAQQGQDVVLVALTGRGMEDDRRRSKEAGFDFHMTKPVELDSLQKILSGLSQS
jgi:PAS domain S-box-containing protein